MIDTIVLTLPISSFHISNPDAFTPSALWAVQGNINHGIQSKQNPTKRELQQGQYKPRLTLSACTAANGLRVISLKIEVSLPKLLFGNNFDELQLKDFPVVVNKLVATLEQMGVSISAATLAKSAVSSVHYSKNIALTDGSTPYYYIQKIKQANVKLSLDTNETNYRNDGLSYKWHCNSYEVVFYDKIRDLEKAKHSSKRSLEKDNEIQLHLFNTFAQRNKLEILRMEVRLNKRQKIKQLLQSLGIEAVPSFRNLFKPTISKQVLLHYLDELERKRPALLDYRFTNDKALLTDLLFSNPELSPKRIFQIYGLTKAFQFLAPRELRLMFGKCSSSTWSRFMNELHEIKLVNISNNIATIKKLI